jgi:hypothetical protein
MMKSVRDNQHWTIRIKAHSGNVCNFKYLKSFNPWPGSNWVTYGHDMRQQHVSFKLRPLRLAKS